MKPFDIIFYLDASLMAVGKIVQIIKQSFEPNEITCSYVDFASDINDRWFSLEETAQVKNQQTMVLNGKTTWPQLATFTMLMDEYLDELNQKNDLRGVERDSLSIDLGVSNGWGESDRLVVVRFVEFERLIDELRVLKPGDDFRWRGDSTDTQTAGPVFQVDKIIQGSSGVVIQYSDSRHNNSTKRNKFISRILRKKFVKEPGVLGGLLRSYWMIRDIDPHEGFAGSSMNSKPEEEHD